MSQQGVLETVVVTWRKATDTEGGIERGMRERERERSGADFKRQQEGLRLGRKIGLESEGDSESMHERKREREREREREIERERED